MTGCPEYFHFSTVYMKAKQLSQKIKPLDKKGCLLNVFEQPLSSYYLYMCPKCEPYHFCKLGHGFCDSGTPWSQFLLSVNGRNSIFSAFIVWRLEIGQFCKVLQGYRFIHCSGYILIQYLRSTLNIQDKTRQDNRKQEEKKIA